MFMLIYSQNKSLGHIVVIKKVQGSHSQFMQGRGHCRRGPPGARHRTNVILVSIKNLAINTVLETT